MASIAEWIQKIKTAIYGEEVRGAIWQSLQAMNDELTSADVTQIPVNKADIANLRTDMTAVQGDLNEQITSINGAVFQEGSELAITYESQGYKLKPDGYRISDDDYNLVRYRVFEGDYVRVKCDHIWQFQTTRDVTASGTQYIVGLTHGVGDNIYKVPPTVTYVVASTPINGSNMHVYKVGTSFDGVVRFDESQTLTDAQKLIARGNIGATDITLDDTLTDASKAAPAKKTGGELILLNDNLSLLESTLYTESSLELRKTNDGYKLNEGGYRVTDANYKLDRYRVFAGDTVKVVSDDRWQFQSTVDVTTSGTQYIIGEKHGAGTVYAIVPEGAVYVVLSTPITGSGSSVSKLTSNVDALNEELDTVEADIENSRNDFSTLINAYTSQVSDIEYPGTPTEVTVGIDTSVPKFTSGNQHAVCIPIISGTTIRLTKPQTNYCLVCFTSDYPAANVSITHYTSMTGIANTNIVAESLENDNYLVIYTHTVTLDPSDCDISYSQVARGTVELLPQLDEHMVNLLKYRPVGKVSKPYIALSCDDGTAALATYTLPRIQYWNAQYNTDIPLHMALFDNCDVFGNDTYKALVVDMCENHNCSIGIHGDRPFGDYSSMTALYAYMKKQRDAIITETGVTPTSVMYPHSSYNDKIMVMAGAFCGACGVANGSIDTPYTYTDDLGYQFYIGEKTNCYTIYRLNIKDTRIGGTQGVHRIIDYAKAHNLIICPYFHDNDFTNQTEEVNTFNRAMLDEFISYGMAQGVEFINFGDIPKML